MSNKSLIIGRFQPFHAGHAYLVKDAYDRGRTPIIAIRDTPYNRENPFSIYERRAMIHQQFGDFIETVVIPDIDEVIYGRTPGWALREVEPPSELAVVSGTANRKGFLSAPKGTIVWITGNTGSGKSTLARALRPHLSPCLIIDGDEIRESFSSDLGFSMEDRMKQNERVAKFAVQASKQMNVIVAVIAPTADIRARIETIINPRWVYVSRGKQPTAATPYEPPDEVDALRVDPFKTADSAALDVAAWLGLDGET